MALARNKINGKYIGILWYFIFAIFSRVSAETAEPRLGFALLCAILHEILSISLLLCARYAVESECVRGAVLGKDRGFRGYRGWVQQAVLTNKGLKKCHTYYQSTGYWIKQRIVKSYHLRVLWGRSGEKSLLPPLCILTKSANTSNRIYIRGEGMHFRFLNGKLYSRNAKASVGWSEKETCKIFPKLQTHRYNSWLLP